MWSSLEDICSVFKIPYSATINLQTESLTPGAFLKEWCALKQILHERETRLAQEIVASKEKRQKILLRDRLSCWSVCRLQIPNFANIRANGKCKDGLHEVTLKNYHCSASVSKSASSSIESEKSPGRLASDHQSSTSEEDEFEKELDLIERRRSSNVRNNANAELDKMKGALNKNIEKIIEIGRLKGETVWDVIKQLEKPLLTAAQILSAMPVTQVSWSDCFLP